MAKTVLIAGKEMPAGSKFADGIALTERNIVITGPELESDEDTAVDGAHSQKISEASGISIVEWNKSSAIASRTLILHTENAFGQMDEAVLYFDEDWFSSMERQMTTEECIRVCDDLILPYQFLALEVLSRFEKKNSAGKAGNLVFLLKEGPCIADTLRSPAVRNGVSAISSPIVAAAAASFASFAENIAALYGNHAYVNILLVRGNRNSDVLASDVELGRWLGTYLQDVEDGGIAFDAKRSLSWIKPGSKQGGGFPFFGKKQK